METIPFEKKHGMRLQINSKEKLKKIVEEEQDGTKDSGTFFLQGVVFFLFLN